MHVWGCMAASHAFIGHKKLEDTNAFRTDLKQVFDFIRCSEDKEKLEELIKADAAYQTMLYAERKSKYVQSINRIDRRWEKNWFGRR